MNNAANSILAALNAGGTVTVQGQFVTVYPDQTNTLVSASFTRYNVVPGSASYSTNNMWQSSGPATGSGFATHFWSYTIPASNGANATGLGKTFPGGTAGGAAPTTSFSNVAVTPGTSYPIVVPAGGQVSISYMK